MGVAERGVASHRHLRGLSSARSVSVLSAAIFVPYATVALWMNRQVLFFGYDGAYYWILSHLYVEGNQFFGFQGTATQGLFSLGLPFAPFALWPVAWLSQVSIGGLGPTLAYLLVAVLAYGVAYFFARQLSLTRVSASALGWLVPLSILPLSWPPLLYPYGYLAPYLAVGPIVALLITGLVIWALQPLGPLVTIGRAALAAAVSCAVMASLPLNTVHWWPVAVVLVLGVGVAYRQEGWRAVSAVATALLPPTVLALLIVLPMLAGSAASAYSSDLGDIGLDSLTSVSMLIFGGPSYFSSLGPAFGVLALASVVPVWLLGRAKARIICLASVGVWVSLLLSALAARVLMENYVGPSPHDYEFVLYPFLLVSIVYGIQVSIERLTAWDRPRLTMMARSSAVGVFIALFAVALILSSLDIPTMYSSGARRADWRATAPIPPRSTPFLDDVQAQIGLTHTQEAFRGYLATVGPAAAGEATSWPRQAGADSVFMLESGADPRALGPWYFGIGTVFTYSQTLMPSYFEIVRTTLAGAEAVQTRNVLVLNRANTPVLEMMGVSQILAYQPLQESRGLRLVSEYEVGSQKLYRYELSQVTDRAATPTETLVMQSIRATADAINRPDFDFRRVAIVQSRLAGQLHPADARISMSIDEVGVKVGGTEGKEALVVLPLQFSSCWQSSGDTVELMRVNGTQLGMLVRGDTEISLRLVLNPLSNPLCAWQDLLNSRSMLADEGPGIE